MGVPRLAIILLPLATTFGCSSLQIDENTKRKFAYDTSTVNQQHSYCFTNKDTKIVTCNYYTIPITTVTREVSIAKSKRGNDCYVIINGEIDSRLASDVLKAIEGLSSMSCSRKIAALNSPGGDVQLAMKVGNKIRDAGLITIFDSSMGKETRCASACTLIFIGGVERIATKNILPFFTSEMGFHKWSKRGYQNKLCVDDEDMIKQLQSYTSRLLPAKSALSFIHFTLQAECGDLQSISPGTLIKNQIATGDELQDAPNPTGPVENNPKVSALSDLFESDEPSQKNSSEKVPAVPGTSCSGSSAQGLREWSRRYANTKEIYIDSVGRAVKACLASPTTARENIKITIHAIQNPDGTVVKVYPKNPSHPSHYTPYEQAAVNAVTAASPLPLPADLSLFSRELVLNFEI